MHGKVEKKEVTRLTVFSITLSSDKLSFVYIAPKKRKFYCLDAMSRDGSEGVSMEPRNPLGFLGVPGTP